MACSAASSRSRGSARIMSPPTLPQPKPISDICSPVLPRARFLSMFTLFDAPPPPPFFFGGVAPPPPSPPGRGARGEARAAPVFLWYEAQAQRRGGGDGSKGCF